MTEASAALPVAQATVVRKIDIGLQRRYRAERRFRVYGIVALSIGIACVVMLFSSIISRGYTAFEQTRVTLLVDFDPKIIAPNGDRWPTPS